MAKFWRSGMIDKKVIREREQAEYINKLERVILELRREEPDVNDLINGIDYDEVRVGDNVVLEFKDGSILAAPRDSVSEALLNFNKQFITKPTKTPVKDAIIDSYSYWLRKNADKRCKADIEFDRKVEALENENNTCTLRQEE